MAILFEKAILLVCLAMVLLLSFLLFIRHCSITDAFVSFKVVSSTHQTECYINSQPLSRKGHRWKQIPELLPLMPISDAIDMTLLSSKKRRFEEITSLSSNNEKLTATSATTTRSAMYVHIPYCRRRCHYCNFAIVPIGETDKPSIKNGFEKMDDVYRKAILDELQLIQDYRDWTENDNNEQKVILKSLYFGGGTPSLAPIDTIRSIFNTICSSTTFILDKDDAEITMEMDPGTFDMPQLRKLKQLGLNRISLGLQTFDDEILEQIGRVHRLRDILDAVSMIREVFGSNANFSIDLISGLPGLTLAKWAETLQYAVEEIRPDHISVYDLQVEKGTKFGRVYGQWEEEDEDGNFGKRVEGVGAGVLSLPTAEECAFMYRYTSAYLRERGYEHYEISSYAKMEKEEWISSLRSKHNSIYWEIGSEWYAVGLGATSSLQGKRYARPRQFSNYIDWVKVQSMKFQEAKQCSGKSWVPDWLPNVKSECGSDDEEYLADVIMTRLRTAEGLDMNWVVMEYGKDKESAILRGAELALDLNLAIMTAAPIQDDIDNGNVYSKPNEIGRWLRLVDPDGFLFSNTIISNIFMELNEIGNEENE